MPKIQFVAIVWRFFGFGWAVNAKVGQAIDLSDLRFKDVQTVLSDASAA
jgi:hypothetical protein